MIHKLLALGELVKFSHTVFALPFALMAAVLAGGGWFGWGKLGLILLCMASARTVAMTFNRIVDYRIDARNPRTAGRPLQTGRVTLAQAGVLLLFSTVAFALGCAGFWWAYGNTWPIRLAGAVLTFVCAYSLAKRFTSLSHIMLGAALGLSPLAAWLAVQPATFGLAAVALGLAVTCWTAGFDIIYALQDVAVDRQQALRSLPARLGPGWALRISRALHAAMIGLLLWLKPLAGLGGIYLAGVLLAAVLLAVEQTMVSAGDTRRAAKAFHVNAAVSMAVALAAVVDVALR